MTVSLRLGQREPLGLAVSFLHWLSDTNVSLFDFLLRSVDPFDAYFSSAYALTGSLVLDPLGGGGTTLIEAASFWKARSQKMRKKLRTSAPVGLGFVDRGDICKRRAIDAFNREWKSAKNRENAYETAKQAMETCIERLGIVNKGAITGLRAELLYYYMKFDSQKLAAESASGLHSDFRAIIRNRPAAIDVTTTPEYKNPDLFMQVKQAFGRNWNYYVGVVDLKNPDVQTYPLLLPRCEDGNLGHFVLVIETDEPNDYLSERQMLVRYNPYAPDEDAAIEKVEASWNFVISNPSVVWDDIESDFSYDEEDDRSRMEGFMMRDFLRYASGLAYEFRQESGFNLSAIVTCEMKSFTPVREDWEWVTQLWWVHPHSFVRRILGKPLTYLDHNIAGAAYDL